VAQKTPKTTKKSFRPQSDAEQGKCAVY